MTDLPCSPYLREKPRSEAEALADRIEKRRQFYTGRMWVDIEPAEASLLVRALRAYKPTGGETC